MKIIPKKIIIFLISVVSITSVYGLVPVSTNELLLSYLENDSTLKNNTIEAEKAALSQKSTQISNGFDISLSTGTITIKSDSEGTGVSVKPSVKATIPQASNLALNLSSNVNVSQNNTSMENTSINASVDIISSSGLTRKISLLKAQRSVTEAVRKVKNQAINSEKAFYSELQSLLKETDSIITLEKTLYTNKIDFETIKAQGYSESSSTYRLAQAKVLSSEHQIEAATRSLKHSYQLFYKKCGYDIDIDDNTSFYDLIPTDIESIESVDIHSFNPDLYSETESALWTNKINSLVRQSKKSFSLSANAGFTFENTSTNSNTVDAGLTASYSGVGLSAGVNLPVENGTSPAFTLSASLSPNTFRQNSITKKSDSLEEEQELLAIKTARSELGTKITECEQNLEDLLWTKKTNQESYEMYEALEKDLQKWYEAGIISESEYYSAKVNRQSYYVQKIINEIDFIIYNDNVVTMFVEEIEE